MKNLRPFFWPVTLTYLAAIYLTLPIARDIVGILRKKHIFPIGIYLLFVLGGATALAAMVFIFKVRRLAAYAQLAALAGALGLFIADLEVAEERFHFIQYSLLALGFFCSLSATRKGSALVLATFACTALAGVLDEVIQYFLPSRVFDLRDIGFNALAGAAGTIACAIIAQPKEK